MIKLASTIIFFFLYFGIVKGQDVSFSTLEASRNYYNPAFTGMSNGIRISAINRRQWPNIVSQFPNSLFKSNYINIEALIPNFVPCGISYFDNTEGEGRLHTSKFAVSLGLGNPRLLPDLHLKKYRKLRSQIAVNARLGWYSQRIDWQGLQFADQFDPVKGLVQQESSIAAANNPINKAITDLGFLLRVNHSNQTIRNLFSIGYSLAPILPNIDVSIMKVGTKIPIKKSLQCYGFIELPKTLGIRHAGFYFHYINENQAPYKTQKIGLGARKESFIFTFSFRNRSGIDIKASDALIYTFEWIIEGNHKTFYRLYYSYDMTVSGLAFNTGGSHEGGLVIYYEDAFKAMLSNSQRKKLASVCSGFSDNKFSNN